MRESGERGEKNETKFIEFKIEKIMKVYIYMRSKVVRNYEI